MKKIVLILFLTFLSGITTEFFGQTGGRKRENRNQRKKSSKFGGKSAGNADAFARGGTNKRTSKKSRVGVWVYRPTPSSKKQNRESRYLFSRYRTKGKKNRDGLLTKQNHERSSRRVRGNKVFHKRKF